MPILTVISRGARRAIEFTPPANLYSLLVSSGEHIHAPCGGRGRCRKCVVTARGALCEPDDVERKLFGDRQDTRLACRTTIYDSAEVVIADASEGALIQIDGDAPPFAITPGREGFGVAVDIGTTTIAAYLLDMASGKLLDARSALNPQAAHGADVISRIGAALEGRGDELARLVRGKISLLVREMADSARIPLGDVNAAAIVGNTAMLHLLCALDVRPLSAMPFRAEHLFGEYLGQGFAESLGLPDGASLFLPRCAGAYVGADITAAMLAGGLTGDARAHGGKPLLLVDIGTNGEMALAANSSLCCCATAAGPAFEGAGISCGMLAAPGAICRADWSDGEMRFSVIGGGEAKGICGTGLIDAAGALLDAGLLDETGYLENSEYVFPGTSVAITQADIRALQLVKSAICAGMKTLLHESGLTAQDVGELVIAGGFGSHIRAKSAERIGLIPRGLAAKARSIGNGAGTGAGMILLSEDERALADAAASEARVVELSANPVFMDAYVDGMMFE